MVRSRIYQTWKSVGFSLIGLSLLSWVAPLGRPALAASPQAQQSPEQPATPLLLAQYEGCPRAEIEEAFETDNFLVYICRIPDGFFYRGINKSTGDQINVMNAITGRDGTWNAVNGNYTYTVNRSQLVVYEDDTVILSEGVW